jgi:hypothetical protein
MSIEIMPPKVKHYIASAPLGSMISISFFLGNTTI